MEKERFEELIIEYLEGTLSAPERQAFERHVQESPDNARVVAEYRTLLSIEKKSQRDNFRASTGFSHRVMDKVRAQPTSLLRRMLAFFASPTPAFTTILAAGVIMLTTWHFIPSQVPAPRQTEPAEQFATLDIPEIEPRVPLNAFTGPNGSPALNFSSLLNSSQLPFPPGSGDAVRVSYEALQLSEHEVIVRVSFSAPHPNDNERFNALRDVDVALEFDPEVAKSVVRITDLATRETAPLKRYSWAHAARLQFPQQFTVLALVQLNDWHFTQGDLVRGFVGLAGMRAEQPTFTITMRDLLASTDRASAGLQRIVTSLFGIQSLKQAPSRTDPTTQGTRPKGQYEKFADTLREGD